MTDVRCRNRAVLCQSEADHTPMAIGHGPAGLCTTCGTVLTVPLEGAVLTGEPLRRYLKRRGLPGAVPLASGPCRRGGGLPAVAGAQATGTGEGAGNMTDALREEHLRYRFYLTSGTGIEREVTMDQYVSAGTAAGFSNSMGRPDLPATASWSNTAGGRSDAVSGRMQYVLPERLCFGCKTVLPRDENPPLTVEGSSEVTGEGFELYSCLELECIERLMAELKRQVVLIQEGEQPVIYTDADRSYDLHAVERDWGSA